MSKLWKKFKNSKYKILWIILILIVGAGLLVGAYYLPPVHSRLAWRVSNLRAKIYYFFNPPDQEAFTPAQQAEMDDIVLQTMTALTPVPTATLQPSLTPTNYVPPTPGHSHDGGTPPHWHRDIDSLPTGPLFLVANEFLDALPIRQFQLVVMISSIVILAIR